MVVLYFLVCLFIVVFSPTALLYVGHDVSPVIDGAWRIENHQIPHKDFPSILGHGYLLQQYFFLKIFGFDFIAFAVSSIALTTILFFFFLSFYRSRYFLEHTGPALRIYFFLLLLSLGLGQYHFGVGHTLLTYANLYNRYCFACLFVLSVQGLLLKNVKKIDAAVTVRLVMVGLLLNYLLFVKLTYFVVAIGLLTVYLLASVISFSVYWRLLLIGLFIFIGAVWAFDADFQALLRDYKTVSLARGKVLAEPGFIRYKLLQFYNLAFLSGLLLLLAEMVSKKLPFRYVLLILFVGLCAVVLQFTNWGATDIVMLTFVPAVFMAAPAFRTALTFKLFLALCCFFIFKNLRSIYYLSKVKTTQYPELKSPYLSRFYTDFTEAGCRRAYAPWVMSGVALVDKNKSEGDKVFSFSFDNPFPFLTHTVPPKHVSTVWQYATTYTYAVHQPPEQLFGDVDLLLVPKCPKAESATEMLTIYGNTVSNHYAIIDGNDDWALYRKKKPL